MNSPRAETLDLELNDTINKIYNGCQKINDKHLKIRILQWLDKVRTPTHNFIWKQNSLLYARVLLEMTLEKQLDKPFRGVPPDGPLPRLDKFDVQASTGLAETETSSVGPISQETFGDDFEQEPDSKVED
ncbi:unnamed protein product (macronuclear) [Paramecium tetraurelia]|uniref:DUF4485 domain-containing protein n=1 Tax=Paramecium tetraurelia TaxID=5888 RepID=A0BX93_PARTE|nr:uncharacterized protein GSPATT00033013001 [Paramecium tetraurelia]CAK63160.1 unnamed protein product [Paramecium tetraurelia]|eukprot:XP_001430558.1 hypothetical protein (macronuclear) [Paramecium tetraurelia strain d4-2]